MNIKIPVYKPSLGNKEKEYVLECLDSTWISSKGPFIEKFEKAFASYLGVKYAATTSNGTTALHLTMLAAGVGSGDEVIVPTFTYIASVNAITYTGAKPVFVDSLRDTWQMDPAQVKSKISKRTKAILAVHVYGHPCEMSELIKISKTHNILLIEDCAEAIGSKYEDRYVGTFGDLSAFSFFGNKTITTGEGGMVISNNQQLIERVIHYKGQGLAVQREYWHDVVGYNYRMTNICAAIGLAQLNKIDSIVARKRDIGRWYKKQLADLPIEFHDEKPNVVHTYWMCSILLNSSQERKITREKLIDAGIDTRPTFSPIHTMPMYNQENQKHIVAEDLGSRGINLPSYPDLSKEDIILISNIIRDNLTR